MAQMKLGVSELWAGHHATPAFYAGAAAMAERFAAGKTLNDALENIPEGQGRWYAVKISDGNGGTRVIRCEGHSADEVETEFKDKGYGPLIVSVLPLKGEPTEVTTTNDDILRSQEREKEADYLLSHAVPMRQSSDKEFNEWVDRRIKWQLASK